MAGVPAEANETSLPRLLQAAAINTPHRVAYRKRLSGGGWQSFTWHEVWQQVQEAACALRRLGLKRGDRMAIVARTRVEWQIAELAGQLAGGIIVGIDPHASAEQISFLLDHAEASALLADDREILAKVPAATQNRLKFIVAFDHEPGLKCVPWRELIAGGQWTESLPDGDDAAALLFTAGTTGSPKAILYTHAQIVAGCRAIDGAFPPLEPSDSMVCWLPMSHLFQRMANVAAMNRGLTTYFAEDPRKIMDDVRLIRPAVFIAVPRFYEKLYDGIQLRLAEMPGWKRRLAERAVSTGIERSQRLLVGAAVPAQLQARFAILDWLVLRQIRKAMGGRIKFMITGSAPTPRWLLEYLFALGWLVLEAYGMSENTVPIAMNTPGRFRFGSVGPRLPGNELRLAEDGEVLVKGAGLFAGYEKTDQGDELFTPDGFYKSGDYGHLDADGFLFLHGRRGDIFKLSTGRRIAPAPIEAAYRRCNYVDQIVIFGEGRAQLVALVVLKPDCTAGREKVARAMESVASELADYERVRAFRILPQPLSMAEGELTPTLKLRRSRIAQRHAAIIDEMYRELQGRRPAASASAAPEGNP